MKRSILNVSPGSEYVREIPFWSEIGNASIWLMENTDQKTEWASWVFSSSAFYSLVFSLLISINMFLSTELSVVFSYWIYQGPVRIISMAKYS